MSRTAIAILLILIIQPLGASAQETAEQILVRTEEVYRNLDTYHFRGSISYEWMGADNSNRIFQSEFQSFKGEGGKLRHQQGIGMSKVLAATDGFRSLIYLAELRQYCWSDSFNLEGFIRKRLGLENPAWIFPAISLLDKYSNLRVKFHKPNLVSVQKLSVKGEAVDCYVLEGMMEPADIDAVRGNSRTELWIHKDRHVVLREIHRGTLTDLPVRDVATTETIVFSVAEPDAVPEPAVFEFQPPRGTEQVKELFGQGETLSDPAAFIPDDQTHAFYYELPFLKMKHFRLPTVDGDELALETLRGKLVLLDFWATWCVPCHKQMKDLKKILREYEGKDLVVLGLNNEELDVTRKFLETHKSTYPMLVDVGGELMSLYGVSNLPVLVLLDRSGNIVSVRRERQSYKQIDQLLKEAGL